MARERQENSKPNFLTGWGNEPSQLQHHLLCNLAFHHKAKEGLGCNHIEVQRTLLYHTMKWIIHCEKSFQNALAFATRCELSYISIIFYFYQPDDNPRHQRHRRYALYHSMHVLFTYIQMSSNYDKKKYTETTPNECFKQKLAPPVKTDSTPKISWHASGCTPT